MVETNVEWERTVTGPAPSACTKRNVDLPITFDNVNHFTNLLLYPLRVISSLPLLTAYAPDSCHLRQVQNMQPRDPNPDGLEDIQAVLNSFCQLPNPTTPLSPAFNCETLPDPFNLNNVSFFSPPTGHEPVQALDSDTSSATPSPVKSFSPNIRRRQTVRVTRAQTARAPRNLPKLSARTNTRTRYSRQRRKQKVTAPSASHLPSLPTQKNNNVIAPAADPVPIGNSHAYTAANDDIDSGHFIHQMRRLTELKLQAEKRKRDSAVQKAVRRIEQLAAKSETEMRRIAGVASRDVTKGINSLKRSLPLANLSSALSDAKRIAEGEQTATRQKILEDVRDFEAAINRAGAELCLKRMETFRATKAEERKMLHARSIVSEKRKSFRNTLVKIERILTKDGKHQSL